MNINKHSYMIYVGHVILNKFAVDIDHSSFYCVNSMALSVNVICFPFEDNVYMDF